MTQRARRCSRAHRWRPIAWELFQKEWNGSFWVFLAIGSFAVIPILEETFYRGYAQSTVERSLGFSGALFVAALFVTAHFQYFHVDVLNVGMLASLFVMAIAMTFLRSESSSILGPTLLHALMNIPASVRFDWLVVLAMCAGMLLLQSRLSRQLSRFAVIVRGVSASDLIWLFAMVAAFASGMLMFPQTFITIAGGAFVWVLVSRRRSFGQ